MKFLSEGFIIEEAEIESTSALNFIACGYLHIYFRNMPCAGDNF